MKRLRIDEKIDLVLDSKVTLRVYADCRPHVFQTAKLQKGAIIVHNGMELVEEGLGIGVPVCRYRDGTRFSLSADTFVDDSDTNPTVVKIFDMNGVVSKRFRGAPIRRHSYLARLLKLVEKGYRRVRRFRTEATLMMDVLSLLGMRNEYSESRSKGQITVTYCRSGRELKINATVDGLSSEGWRVSSSRMNKVAGYSANTRIQQESSFMKDRSNLGKRLRQNGRVCIPECMMWDSDYTGQADGLLSEEEKWLETESLGLG